MPATLLKDTQPTATEQEVKRFLRHRGSRQYYKDGGWTSDPCEARVFADVLEAAEICAVHGLSDVELTLRYQSSSHDLFATPIR